MGIKFEGKEPICPECHADLRREIHRAHCCYEPRQPHPEIEQSGGPVTIQVSLRDLFAMAALSNMSLKDDGKWSHAERAAGQPVDNARWCARAAYRYAHCMLLERERQMQATGNPTTREEHVSDE